MAKHRMTGSTSLTPKYATTATQVLPASGISANQPDQAGASSADSRSARPEGVRTEAANPCVDRLAPFAGRLAGDPVRDARAEATELPLDGQGAGLLG